MKTLTINDTTVPQTFISHEDPFQDAGLSKRFKKAEFGQDGQVVLIAQFYD